MLRLIPVGVDDGYTEKGKWAYNGSFLTYRYRPALPRRVASYMAENKRTPEERMQVLIPFLVEHLVSWDGIVDEKNQPVAITADTLLRIPYPFLDSMLDTISGYKPEKVEDDLKT